MLFYLQSAQIWIYGLSTNITDRKLATEKEKDFIPADVLGAAIQEGKCSYDNLIGLTL